MTTHTADLLVVGAGPAGMAAAIEATGFGLSTVVVDEGRAPGGQVYRKPSGALKAAHAGKTDGDGATGDGLRDRLARSGADVLQDRQIWALESGFVAHLVGADGPETVTAPRVIVASGAHERQLPFPGWTHPSVIGLAAATVLLKAEHTLPGERIVVAGAGPLIYAVSAGVLALGGSVSAVIDLATRGQWASALPGLAARPDLLVQGARWMADIRAAGVPVHFGHAVRAAEHGEDGLTVTAAPVRSPGSPDDSKAFTVSGDALCVGYGLTPSTELVRLAGARVHYDRLQGGWVPERDDGMRLSVPGLYAAGDGAGILGAGPSETEGRLAAASAAMDAGLSGDVAPRARTLRRTLKRQSPAGRASARLMASRPVLVTAIEPDCIVCRCEDVRRNEIDAAIADGAADVNQLKAWTRCGMGPCQGRMCSEAVAELVAARVGGREAAGIWTARSPFKPLDIADLVGDYDYQDIPMPKPAPL